MNRGKAKLSKKYKGVSVHMERILDKITGPTLYHAPSVTKDELLRVFKLVSRGIWSECAQMISVDPLDTEDEEKGSYDSWAEIAVELDCFELFLAFLTAYPSDQCKWTRERPDCDNLSCRFVNSLFIFEKHCYGKMLVFLKRAIDTYGVRISPSFFLHYRQCGGIEPNTLRLLIQGGADPKLVGQFGGVPIFANSSIYYLTRDCMIIFLENGMPLETITYQYVPAAGRRYIRRAVNFTSLELAFGYLTQPLENYCDEKKEEAKFIQLTRMRPHVERLCFGLQSARFPALMTMMILDEMHILAPQIAFHIKWNMITLIKHWHDEKA